MPNTVIAQQRIQNIRMTNAGIALQQQQGNEKQSQRILFQEIQAARLNSGKPSAQVAQNVVQQQQSSSATQAVHSIPGQTKVAPPPPPYPGPPPPYPGNQSQSETDQVCLKRFLKTKQKERKKIIFSCFLL